MLQLDLYRSQVRWVCSFFRQFRHKGATGTKAPSGRSQHTRESSPLLRSTAPLLPPGVAPGARRCVWRMTMKVILTLRVFFNYARNSKHASPVGIEAISARRSRAHRRPACVSSPAKAETSMNSVERGRWKLVISTSTARKLVAGRDEDRGLRRERPDACRPRPAALSSRPQRGRADRDDAPARAARGVERVGGLRVTSPYSACILWSAVSSAFTGRKVPAPTCSVTVRADPARLRAAPPELVREVQAGGRRRHRAFMVRQRRVW